LVAVPSIGRASQVTPRRAAPEADATRDLYERYARQIYAYCFHQLGNREEAEDATQSTFLNAFRGLQRGVDPEFETAWLYKIAQNVCLTRQRSSSRRRRLESPGDLDAMQDYVPAHQPDSDELIHLPQALDAMPEQQRRALLLREWQGLSYKEIGEELGLSQPAVETLLFRARRTLAASLTDEPAPAKKCVAKKLQRGSDAGSIAAVAKTLLLSGGAKVAATIATVAATSVVVAAPATRHAVEDVVAPRHDIVPVHQVSRAAHHATAPVYAAVAAAPARRLASAGAVSPPVAAAHRVLSRVPLHVAVRRHAVSHTAAAPAAPAPVAPTAPAPAPVASEPEAPTAQAPAEQPAPAPAASRPQQTPAASAPGQQKKVEAAPSSPAPVVDTHGHGNAVARGHDNARREPLSVQAPAAAVPTPAGPTSTTATDATPVAPADPAPADPAANGNANAHGEHGNGNGK
jgi:RNA polymerase sigma factor (sigma-70 family)